MVPRVAGSNYGSQTYVSILRGNGDGTFGAPENVADGLTPVNVVAADVTGDGHLDLAVLNINNTVSLIPGNGDGSFGAAISYEDPAGDSLTENESEGTSSTVFAADLNGDGKLDLLTYGSFGLAALIEQPGTSTGPGAPLSASGTTFQATAKVAFTGTAATFTDGDPADTVGDYAATIAWGDGTTSVGAVTADPRVAGQYDVVGTHTYARQGLFAVSVAISDKGRRPARKRRARPRSRSPR